MRRYWMALLCYSTTCCAAPAAAPPALSPEARELRAYYADRKQEPGWKEAIRILADPDASPGEARKSSAYVVALLEQALKDEQSGASLTRASASWARDPVNPARFLRTRLVESLDGVALRAEGLPVYRWYLEREMAPALQAEAARALGRVGAPADELRREVLAGPHPNALVVGHVLNQVVPRKLALPADKIEALCQHHRAVIRAAARKVAEVQGRKVPAFDAVKAVRSPAVEGLLASVGRLLPDVPPATADFVAVVYTTTSKDGEKVAQWEVRGWLMEEKADICILRSALGQRLPCGLKLAAGEGGTSTSAHIRRGVLLEEVGRVEAARKEQNKDARPTEGQQANLAEAFLGFWLHAAKKDDLAARVLLPALDSLYSDAQLVEIVRTEMGEVQGHAMLAAFAGDRDYEETVRRARLILERFPGTRFHGVAGALAEQLPRRRDDFKELRLPTPKEWSALKAKMTRPQQIDYLCGRLRLLNCFQTARAGGVIYTDRQYAEPGGMSANAAWGGTGGKTEVINPLVELAGRPADSEGPEKRERERGLGLTLADVPLLAPHLRHDWLIPTVSFTQDFEPARVVHSTRPIVADLIDALAYRDLCQAGAWDGLNGEQIEDQVRRISEWARKNASKTKAELIIEAVDEELAAGARWSDIQGRMEELVKDRVVDARIILHRFLDERKVAPYELAEVLALCRRLDPAGARDKAAKYLRHRDDRVRGQAALLLYLAGEKEASRERERPESVLEGVLEGTSDGALASDVAGALLEGKTEAAKVIVRQLFANRHLEEMGAGVRGPLLRRCREAGLVEGYRFYRKLLDVEGRKLGTATFARPVAQEFAEEFLEAEGDEAGLKEVRKLQEKPAEQVEALKRWLDARIRKLEGK